jgi:hypothetical protein
MSLSENILQRQIVAIANLISLILFHRNPQGQSLNDQIPVFLHILLQSKSKSRLQHTFRPGLPTKHAFLIS